jgi:large subunit ribosomal protein L3e
MVVVGVVGYRETPNGLRCVTSAWAQHLSEDVRRRFYKNWRESKKKAFKKYSKKYATAEGKAKVEEKFKKLAQTSDVIRVIAHTQLRKMKNKQIGTKKAHISEIQVNGGSVAEKVAFARGLLEKEIGIDCVFKPSECADICAVTRGHGFTGVIQRWGVTRLPRKTHRGLRKVACIGSWHPERVNFAVARAGQHGFFHRTEINKKIYMIGKALKDDPFTGKTSYDQSDKTINPMGGFTKYGNVREAFVMLKGTVAGPARRVITLRRPIAPQTSRSAMENVSVKFVDTSSKRGSGRFQTKKEKEQFMGPLKKHLNRQK